MAAQITEQVTLTIMECGECGMTFAVPEGWRRERQETGKGWYCPNGHARVYRESDVDALKKQLEREKRSREAWEAQADSYGRQRDGAQRSAAAHKGQATKLRKRAAAGVCPCCHRTFQQLSRHMKTKHPDYVKEAREAKV